MVDKVSVQQPGYVHAIRINQIIDLTGVNVAKVSVQQPEYVYALKLNEIITALGLNVKKLSVQQPEYETALKINQLISLLESLRWAYDMDGIDDRWTLANRAIDVDGDIDIEFRTGPNAVGNIGTEYCVISQCLSNNFSLKEFRLYFNASANALQAQVGGAYQASSLTTTLGPNTNYRFLLRGALIEVFVNGVLASATSFTRGASREATAVTVVGAETHGSTTTFRTPFKGELYNIKINGTLWPMSDRNQSIQPSLPAGNNMTGANLNPDRWTEIAK